MSEQRRYGRPYIIREFEYNGEHYIVTGQQYWEKDTEIKWAPRLGLTRTFTWKLVPEASNPYP